MRSAYFSGQDYLRRKQFCGWIGEIETSLRDLISLALIILNGDNEHC